MATRKLKEAQLSNGAENTIDLTKPFGVKLRIHGTQDILFHRWNSELVEAKAKAKKGSEEKKTEDPESYIYRDEEGFICVPGRYLVRAIVEAGRNFTDPRSSRKAAKDLVQATVMVEEFLSPIIVGDKFATEWDYDDRQRVCIMRSAITRTRPAFKKGWEVDFTLNSLSPEYITPDFLRKLVDNAGKLIGIGDFRPTYGRFVVTQWEVLPFVSAEAV